MSYFQITWTDYNVGCGANCINITGNKREQLYKKVLKLTCPSLLPPIQNPWVWENLFFCSYISGVYTTNLELKIEHQGSHAKFLNLNITFKERTFSISYLIKETIGMEKHISIFHCSNALCWQRHPTKTYFVLS